MNLWTQIKKQNEGRPVLFDMLATTTGKPPLMAGCYPGLNLTGWYFYQYDPTTKKYLTDNGVSENDMRSKQPVAYRRNPFALYVLDIEEWSFAPGSQFGQALFGIEQLKRALKISQEVLELTTGRVDKPGLYSIAPGRDLQVAADPNKKPGTLYYKQWQETNTWVADQLAGQVGFLAPSLYRYPGDLYNKTYYDFVKYNLEESFRLSERMGDIPVASFVWPRWYAGLSHPDSGSLLPYAVFKKDLETILGLGSHVILWDMVFEWSSDKALAHEAILDVAAAQHKTIR